MSVLFLRTAALKCEAGPTSKIPRPTLCGSNDSLAAHLSEAILTSPAWLQEMFGFARNGRPFFKDILCRSDSRSPYAGTYSVSVDTAVLPADCISVYVNERLISDSEELVLLAERIERGRNLELCLPSDFPVPASNSTSPTSPNALCNGFQSGWTNDIPTGLLCVARLALNNPRPGTKLRKMLESLGAGPNSDLWIHLSQHTEVSIKNDQGDARIKFNFDAVNVSLNAVSSRTHRFWFERPQPSISFKVSDQRRIELGVESLTASPHFYEIRVLFPRPLQPLETIKYEISFDAKKAFQDHRFYFVSARTITNRLGLSVVGADLSRFGEAYILNESHDGFLKDNAPVLSISHEGSRQRLHWEVLSPEPGDVFKTFWSYKQDSGRAPGSIKAPSDEANRVFRVR